jgi:hypothetical protein
MLSDVTPEEHLEARAEQLVDAMRVERARHALLVGEFRTDCSCGLNLSAPAESAERDLFAAHVESAVLNVVRTERSQITCPTCGGKRFVKFSPSGAVEDTRSRPCPDCIDGSVPGELLVVGLIGEQAGWLRRDEQGPLFTRGRLPGIAADPVYRIIEREAPQ